MSIDIPDIRKKAETVLARKITACKLFEYFSVTRLELSPDSGFNSIDHVNNGRDDMELHAGGQIPNKVIGMPEVIAQCDLGERKKERLLLTLRHRQKDPHSGTLS